MVPEQPSSSRRSGKLGIDHALKLCGVAALLATFTLTVAAAYADCETLRNGVAILASDLADQATAIEEGEGRIRQLEEAIEAAADADLEALDAQRSAEEASVAIAREKYDEIVGKIADRGERIREECPVDGQ